MTIEKKKIILCGYRATGKTTVGRLLAERLGWRFIDTDQEIEKRQGCSIARMVAAHGWDFFRGLERELLLELVSAANVVIASGGGAITHQDAWSRLMAEGLVVWLTAGPETICARLAADRKSAGQRPTLTGSDIFSEVKSVLAEREPLYRRGSHLAMASTVAAAELAEQIIKRLSANPEPLLKH